MSPSPSRLSAPPCVEDDARVGLRGDVEGDARRDVGLDQAGDDVDRGPLGGHHEVHADRAAELAEADDGVLDLGRRDHHEVGELVHDDDDVRQRLLAGRAPGVLFSSRRSRAFSVRIMSVVAAVHLVDDVVQHAAGVA